MTMAEVGRSGQRIDPLNGGDVAPDGTLLSVWEIQQHFREQRALHEPAAGDAQGARCDSRPRAAVTTRQPREHCTRSCVNPAARPSASSTQTTATATVLIKAAAPSAPAPATRQPETAASGDSRAKTQSPGGRSAELHLAPSWVRVLAGYSGAGASTVALAIADAAAAAGRHVQLVEAAHPSRSGLVAASSAELGLDETGAWRRGTRGQPALVGQVVIARRAGDAQPQRWPIHDADTDDSSQLVAVDLGLVPTDALDAVAERGSRVVIACRPTIPGVRLTEQLLDRLGDVEAVVAMLGQRRWPGELASSSGPRLRALRDAGRVVPVPLDRRLEVAGATYIPLPKAILAAGRELLGALDAARPGGVTT